MLFNKNDSGAGEQILYRAKPNMILGCKKAIYGFVLLVIVMMVSPTLIQFIGEMQVYMISYVKLSLTRYAAIAFFVIILIIVIYIIWQLVAWHSVEYTLTDSRVIIKSGVLSTKKNYMPYTTIQDVNSSQSIFAKMFNVGSVSIYSAYDNNQMVLSNISNPSQVEEIVFSHIVGPRNFQQVPGYAQRPPVQDRSFETGSYIERNDYHDEYEPITPITHEKYSPQRREYEYYPEEFDFEDNSNHTYEYEPYDGTLESNVDRAMEDSNPQNRHSQRSYYNEVRDDYSYAGDDYSHNNDRQNHYNDVADEYPKNHQDDVGQDENSSQKAIKRHFDKFKK